MRPTLWTWGFRTLPVALCAWLVIGIARQMADTAPSEHPHRAYDRAMVEAARRHGLSPELVKALVWRESDFEPTAIGEAGQIGLMQLTPPMIRAWADYRGEPIPKQTVCLDPTLNIEIGTWYLATAMRRWQAYRGAAALALVHYRRGEKHAAALAPRNPARELDPDEIDHRPTRDYINQVRRKWHEFEKKYPASG